MKAVLSLRLAMRWLHCGAICLLAVLFAARAPHASAAVIDIDTFAFLNPAQFFQVPIGMNTSTTVTNAVAGVIGGEREALFQVIGNAVGNSANGLIGDQAGLKALQLTTIGLAPTVATLTYDGVGNVGLGGVDLITASVNNRFELSFVGADAQPTTGLGIVITVTSNSGSSTASATAPNQQSAFVVPVPFSSFVGSANFSAVNSIVVQFNGANQTPNIDFELTGITAVPEPASVAMMALGGALVCIQLARRGNRRER
jgi:hypothetical protein